MLHREEPLNSLPLSVAMIIENLQLPIMKDPKLKHNLAGQLDHTKHRKMTQVNQQENPLCKNY
jgi:hypothetical protein